MAADSRHTAFKILVAVELQRQPLDQVLEHFEKPLSTLSGKDRALANSIVFGTLRWRGKIDWIIKAFTRRKISDIDTRVLYAIRIALFQIMCLDRIPVSAAVNTAVSIAKTECGKKPAGFVNAVLRNASEHYRSVAFPDPEKDSARFLSVTGSIPLWLAKRWIDRYGLEKCVALCEAINQVPGITVRTNTLKTDRTELFPLLQKEAANVRLTDFSPAGISFTTAGTPVHKTHAFEQGLFQVQDEAAQLVTCVLDPVPGDTVLDLCAGLGGKSGHAAQLMKNRGKIVAADINREKLNRLEREMERLSVAIVEKQVFDVLNDRPGELKNAFDKVLVDAPCSGLGVLKRNPDTRWFKSTPDIERLVVQQQQMLLRASDFVKPGGILVFSVCSAETDENEGVVSRFLDQQKSFCLDVPPGYPDKRFDPSLFEKKFFKSYPHAPVMDGFFAARLKKRA